MEKRDCELIINDQIKSQSRISIHYEGLMTDQFDRAKVFSKLDFKSRYHQVRLKELDIQNLVWTLLILNDVILNDECLNYL